MLWRESGERLLLFVCLVERGGVLVRLLQAIFYRLEGVLGDPNFLGVDTANALGFFHLGRELKKDGSHVLQYVKGISGVIHEINAKAGKVLGFGGVVGHRREV
jgi:hypothetical protein